MSVARDYVFEDVIKKRWEPITQPSSVRLYEEEHIIPHVLKLPLREFFSDHKVVVSDKPVQVVISSEANEYFAENESLSIYAIGDSVESAIQEFSHHVVYFFEYYKNKSENEVIGKAARLKELYENHFVLV